MFHYFPEAFGEHQDSDDRGVVSDLGPVLKYIQARLNVLSLT